MFTGIVEEVGVVRGVVRTGAGMTLQVACGTVTEGSGVGDSILVGGACLTATTIDPAGFRADISTETLRVTTLGQLAVGVRVNLERSLALGGRLGGHLVTGHVDGVGSVRAVKAAGNATEIWFDTPQAVLRLCVVKGSIAVDGISLTVNQVDARGLSVTIIPHTATATTLLERGVGAAVNLEADLIGKYVDRLLVGRVADGGIGGDTLDLL